MVGFEGMKKQISSQKAPKATNFFSQAILSDSRYKMELSGQIGLSPESMNLVEGGIKEETEQTFSNIEMILAEVGWNLEHLTKVRVYLADMSDYTAMNEVYENKFVSLPPARITIAVKELPLGAKVEIECFAEGDEISKG